MEGRYEVLGCKGFKGDVEGQHYDSSTLYVKFPVSKRAGTEAGFNAKEVKFGTESEFQKMKGLPFPIIAELDIEITTKGIECLGFKAIGPVTPGKAS